MVTIYHLGREIYEKQVGEIVEYFQEEFLTPLSIRTEPNPELSDFTHIRIDEATGDDGSKYFILAGGLRGLGKILGVVVKNTRSTPRSNIDVKATFFIRDEEEEFYPQIREYLLNGAPFVEEVVAKKIVNDVGVNLMHARYLLAGLLVCFFTSDNYEALEAFFSGCEFLGKGQFDVIKELCDTALNRI